MVSISRRTVLKGVAATPIVGTALIHTIPVAAQDDPVTVGSKDFTEQFILGNMYALLLENAGLEVERAINLGGTAIAHEALVAGEIDLYPEYTGTGLTVVLETPVESLARAGTPGASPAATGTPGAGATIDELVFQVVNERYQEEFDLTWLDQSPFNNTQALAVKRSFSEENDLTTISQMVEMASELTISAPSDFIDRDDGLAGLNRVYGDFEFEKVLTVQPGLKYQALLDDEAQVVLAFGTDGQIFGYDLVVLEDDMNLWPPYHVAPVVRQETLDTYPEVAETLNALAPLLTGEVMSGLNWLVDGDEKRDPEEVAQEFLEENGLLS